MPRLHSLIFLAALLPALGVNLACTRGSAGTRGAQKSYSPTCLEGRTGGITLQSLIDAPPRSTPTRVKVAAWFRGTADCGDCPPDALCQPCMSMLMFSDRSDSPDSEMFYLIKHLEKNPVLRKGCAYRLTLTLERDYREHLAVRDNNPLYFGNMDLFAVVIEDID